MGGRHSTRGAAPGADVPVGLAARTTIAAGLDAVRATIGAARVGKEEGIHQLRVAMRRTRAALMLYEDVLPAVVREFEDELATLGRAVGAVRDLDVLETALVRTGRAIDDKLAAATGTIVGHVREQRAAMHALALATLDAPRTQRLFDRLGRLVIERGRVTPPLGAVAARFVRPLVRDFVRAAGRVDESASPAVLHRARIRAKRLRYALEALQGVGGSSTRELARRLAALQRLLGDRHDAATQCAWLAAEMPTFVGDAEALVALGAIGEALRRRGRKLARQAPAACRHATRSKAIAAALRELGRVA